MDELGRAPAARERVRTLALLFCGGALLRLGAVVLLPVPPRTDASATYICVAVAGACGLVLLSWGERLPGGVILVALAAATAIVSADIYFAGGVRADDQMFYLWVAFYAFYFLPARLAAGELLLVGIGYGFALGLRHEPDASTRWMITMGTLVVAGVLTSRLVARLERSMSRSRERLVAMREAEERFRSAFESAAIGMALVGLDGCWLRVNDALTRLTGYPASELVGQTFQALTVEEDLEADVRALSELAAGERSVYQTEKRYRRADGGVVWVALSVSLVRADDGCPLYLISQMQDISNRKAAEHELRQQALHDPLTGLPNRLLFLDRLAVALGRIERAPGPVTVLFVDLDRFKIVNDSHGHAVGDLTLTAVAERLTAALRPNDTVCRFGGDEFTILCENIGESDARAVAARIAGSLAEQFVIDGRRMDLTASIGAAISHTHATSAEAMLRDADFAMYRAKEHARSRGPGFHFAPPAGGGEVESLGLGALAGGGPLHSVPLSG